MVHKTQLKNGQHEPDQKPGVFSADPTSHATKIQPKKSYIYFYELKESTIYVLIHLTLQLNNSKQKN